MRFYWNPLVYTLFMAAFMWRSRVVTMETAWPTQPKIFTIYPSTVKICPLPKHIFIILTVITRCCLSLAQDFKALRLQFFFFFSFYSVLFIILECGKCSTDIFEMNLCIYIYICTCICVWNISDIGRMNDSVGSGLGRVEYATLHWKTGSSESTLS